MEKINWINGQAGGTPLSAENLNQMQDNIEKEIEGKVLYENANGDNSGNINLNDSVSNYDEVKIDYVVTAGDYKITESKKVPVLSGANIGLTCFMAHSESLQLLVIGRYSLSGALLTRIYETRTRIAEGVSVGWDGKSTGIYITKITGYKY